jgi:hypothetical protein
MAVMLGGEGGGRQRNLVSTCRGTESVREIFRNFSCIALGCTSLFLLPLELLVPGLEGV